MNIVTCQACGAEIPRKLGEPPGRWLARKACSRAHALRLKDPDTPAAREALQQAMRRIPAAVVNGSHQLVTEYLLVHTEAAASLARGAGANRCRALIQALNKFEVTP